LFYLVTASAVKGIGSIEARSVGKATLEATAQTADQDKARRAVF
jgi:hypothetical protein